jgi:ferric-dicitrate binding protein FerR (iron transport regulator)
MLSQKRFFYLLHKYLDSKLSVVEHIEFFEMVSSGDYDEIISEDIHNYLKIGIPEASSSIPPHIAQEIVRNIFKAETNTQSLLPIKTKRKKIVLFVAAASIIALIGVFSLFKIEQKIEDYGMVQTEIPDHTIVMHNTDNQPRLVELIDGSKIYLEPNSSIHFQRNFNETNREIYLDGDAFFEVAKNPSKPFYVYYHNVVAKVLGTSFRVNTNGSTGKIEVSVKTGKVQVYENNKKLQGKNAQHAIIIAPNQKAIYDVAQHHFESTLVEKPMQIEVKDTMYKSLIVNNLKFEQKKLNEIFKLLQTYYGVEIVVENSTIYNCVFTGDVSEQDLFSVLNTICLATNSTYEINQTIVLIKGKGCPGN